MINKKIKKKRLLTRLLFCFVNFLKKEDQRCTNLLETLIENRMDSLTILIYITQTFISFKVDIKTFKKHS